MSSWSANNCHLRYLSLCLHTHFSFSYSWSKTVDSLLFSHYSYKLVDKQEIQAKTDSKILLLGYNGSVTQLKFEKRVNSTYVL
jgi:hypothetical protein